jgi:hypothetical protein
VGSLGKGSQTPDSTKVFNLFNCSAVAFACLKNSNIFVKPKRFHGFEHVVMLGMEGLDFCNMDLIFLLNSMPRVWKLQNNRFHSTCHVQVGVWICYQEVQSLHKDYFLRVCKNMLGNIKELRQTRLIKQEVGNMHHFLLNISE